MSEVIGTLILLLTVKLISESRIENFDARYWHFVLCSSELLA